MESLKLKDKPLPLSICPNCYRPFRIAMRGLVHSWVRKLFKMNYCAVICEDCRKIVAWEKP